ncbi:MAG: guanylate kinase [Lentisphaerae bacterium GWF2_45_14]|nr:MAG: guanylate kinase [Lentisphaerae bacterium GWF2_45_14]
MSSGKLTKGALLIVSGASGTGKSTLCSKLLGMRKNLRFSISCTTRGPRSGEIDGTHYYFLSVEDFKGKVANNEFIEYAEVHGNFYGTLKSEVADRLSCGTDVLLDIDVQGAMQIKEKAKTDDFLKASIELVFIGPPSFEELERRLRNRKTDSEEVIKKRLENARKELSFWREYDYLVINDELEKALGDMIKLLDSIHMRSRHIERTAFDV